jgi:hypothetical protein
MRKKLGLIQSFVSFYAYQIGINMGINIVFLIFLYKRSPEEWAKRCEAVFTDKDMQNSCKDQINASKIGTIVSIVISFLFQCCEFLRLFKCSYNGFKLTFFSSL